MKFHQVGSQKNQVLSFCILHQNCDEESGIFALKCDNSIKCFYMCVHLGCKKTILMFHSFVLSIFFKCTFSCWNVKIITVNQHINHPTHACGMLMCNWETANPCTTKSLPVEEFAWISILLRTQWVS